MLFGVAHIYAVTFAEVNVKTNLSHRLVLIKVNLRSILDFEGQ